MNLHLWTLPVGGRSPRPALERALAPFRKAHPGVEVTVWVLPWGTVWDRLMSALKGRHGAPAPDVMQIDVLWTGTLAYLGLLKELTPRLWEMEKEGIQPALWEACHLPPTRRLFSAPWTLSLRVPRLRAGALSRAGLTPVDLSTWEGVGALLSRAPRSAARARPPDWDGESLLASLAPWLWAAGGDFLSPDERQPAFLSPEALQAADLHRRVLAEGPAAGLTWSPLGPVRDPALSALPPLKGPAGRFSFLGGSALAVAAGTRHAEESWLLFRHLTSPAVQRDFARLTGLLPPRLPEAESLLEGAERESLRHGLACARVPPPGVLLGSFERLFQRHLSAAARDNAPWGEWHASLERAAVEARSLLSLYEPAPV